ncbi:MAG: hypothetical protein Q9220_004373 [cf. Caloplaca sp. 1 TL-2023]
MSAFKGHLNNHSPSNPSSLDTLDMDQYINYDPTSLLPNPSCSPESSRSKSISMPVQPNDYSNGLFLTQSNQQMFAGPSHQYELHKQQTGLPVGALANTIAVNQADHQVYGHAQRMFDLQAPDAYFGMNTTDDLFDFNTPPSPHLGASMEIDFASPAQASTSEHIDPNAFSSQDSSVSGTAAKQRAWPGMHQQQAAMAKAQALQQSQDSTRQQPPSLTARQSSQRSTGNTVPAKDPIVEDRISRLLSQMRHDSVASAADDGTASSTQGSVGHLARAKKDEEDMDEDERLLASEEGKKLSSKERRQLRNKVSARAFRSRRKEYIGQLEGELAAKAAEADELRAKNHDLMSENTRLTDLTRMLLAAPAFNTFLDDMNKTEDQSSLSLAGLQQETPAPKVEDSEPIPAKDVSPHQPSLQRENSRGDAQIGMALMPESYQNFNATHTSWADNMDFGLYDAQVYAVTSLPEYPIIDQSDASLLSGKPTSCLGSLLSDTAKSDSPSIEPMPMLAEQRREQTADVSRLEVDHPLNTEDDLNLALFDDAPHSPKAEVVAAAGSIFGYIQSEKVFERIELTVTNHQPVDAEVSEETMETFLRFCAVMEAPSQRIASVTSHL